MRTIGERRYQAQDVGPLDRVPDGEGSPIGRRIVLGMLGLGAVGVAVGSRVQSGIETALRPVTQNDPTGLTSFVPTAGRFRIYSVVGHLPERSDADYRLTVDGLVDHPLTLTLDQALRDDVLIAHEMQGGPVTREHGGPVRLYVAPMYGYKSLKWLDRIEVVDALDDPSDPGYWERLGYDVDAWVGDSNGLEDEPT